MLALKVLLLASAAEGGAIVLRGAQNRQRQRELNAARALFAAACGCAGYCIAAQLTTTVQPGGMAYYKVRRPLLQPNQRISASLATAACGLALDEAVGVVQSDHLLGASFRRSGRAVVRATDGLQRRWREERKIRQRAKEREWGREHTRPARIHTR
ncbi:hypothetical protein AB1Y20_003163 [Prymnesium parvum]|uniref:Uncharacterized protein n=1 Tax=Prymnesium parvum TaxID=97485 RepID=A0AB34JD20_PRYPA